MQIYYLSLFFLAGYGNSLKLSFNEIFYDEKQGWICISNQNQLRRKRIRKTRNISSFNFIGTKVLLLIFIKNHNIKNNNE